MQPAVRHTSSVDSRCSYRKGYKISALVLLLITFLVFLWSQPKAALYNSFREVIKAKSLWETRKWSEVEGEKFIIRFTNSNEGALWAPLVLKNADEVYQSVTSLFNYTPEGKIMLILHPSRESLGDTFGWESNVSAMGVYWAGVIQILSPNEWLKGQPEEVMLTFKEQGPMIHEFTHFVVDYRTNGNYTRWLTEGIAQYAELKLAGFRFEESNSSLEQELYPFTKMDRNFDNLPNQNLAYRQSLAAVYFLVDTHGEESINELLEVLATGVSQEKAFGEVFGYKDMDDYEAKWRAWLKQNIEDWN